MLFNFDLELDELLKAVGELYLLAWKNESRVVALTNQLNSDRAALQQAVEEAKAENTGIKNELQAAIKEIEKLKKALEDDRAEFNYLSRENKALSTALAEKDRELENKQREVDALAIELEHLRRPPEPAPAPEKQKQRRA